MIVALFALLDGVVVESRRHPSRASVLQAHPIDGVDIFDFFPVNVTVVPKIKAAATVRHEFVGRI